MISPVESAPPVLPQGSEPDVLLRLVPSGVSVVSAPSLGGPDEGPAGRVNGGEIMYRCGGAKMYHGGKRGYSEVGRRRDRLCLSR